MMDGEDRGKEDLMSLFRTCESHIESPKFTCGRLVSKSFNTSTNDLVLPHVLRFALAGLKASSLGLELQSALELLLGTSPEAFSPIINLDQIHIMVIFGH